MRPCRLLLLRQWHRCCTIADAAAISACRSACRGAEPNMHREGRHVAMLLCHELPSHREPGRTCSALMFMTIHFINRFWSRPHHSAPRPVCRCFAHVVIFPVLRTYREIGATPPAEHSDDHCKTSRADGRAAPVEHATWEVSASMCAISPLMDGTSQSPTHPKLPPQNLRGETTGFPTSGS